MNWTLFWTLVIAGALMYIGWLFLSQRQMAYLSVLLYRQGNADAYLSALEAPATKLFFPKKLRRLMAIDAYLLKGDTEALENVFHEVETMKLANTDRLLVMIKKFSFLLDRKQFENAKVCHAEIHRLYDELSDARKKQHEAAVRECDYSNAIVLEHSGYYADELMERGRVVKDDIPSGVYYYKAAQSYYLRTDLKRCEDALEHAEVRLRKTAFHPQLKKMLETKDFDALVNARM